MMTRRTLSWLFRLIVSGGIMVYILRTLPLTELAVAFRNAHLGYVVLSFLLTPPRIYMAAVQMWMLTRAQKISLSARQLLAINLSTAFYGLFLPGYLSGGAIRWYKISRPDKKSVEALAAIGYNRLVELGSVVLLGLVFWAGDPMARTNQFIALVFIGLLVALAVASLLLFSTTASSYVLRFVNRLPLTGWADTARRKLTDLLATSGSFGVLPYSDRGYVLGLSCVRHLGGVISTYLLARSLSLDLSVMNIGWVRSALQIILMLPISLSGLGVREGSLILMLQPYGVSAPAAVALSLLILGRGLVSPAIGGLLEARKLLVVDRRQED